MSSPTQRRPLPALVFLLALTLLAALVWWRVLHRDTGEATPASSCTATQAAKQLPQPAAVTVVVLNSTDRKGLAGSTRDALLKDGFRSPSPPSNDAKQYHNKITGVGQIRHGPLGADAAKLVAYYLPGATLVSTEATDAVVTISLGKAFKALATPKAVTAKLKADGITLVTTSGAVGAGTDDTKC
jgi:hypothetical protein